MFVGKSLFDDSANDRGYPSTFYSSYPSYYPSSFYPSSYYYPLLSDSESRYPYRYPYRSPLSISAYPLYRSAPSRRSWYPSYSLPRYLRDPWWYDLPIYRTPSKSYPSLRHSYLSPIKRTFLWSTHPIRRGTRW